jgi:DNA-binding GntR family transcriptional regulator
MRADILELKLQPGSKLVLDDLRVTYGLSLSPLREALPRLVAEELVLGEEWRGFRVAPVTEVDLFDLTETRREIEVLAVTRSVMRGGDMWAADLARAFRHMSTAGSKGDNKPNEWPDHHRAFHEILVRECGSPRLIKLRTQLFDQFMRYLRLAPDRVRVGFNDESLHESLFEAALARNAEKCRTLVRSHIQVLDVLVDAVRAFNKKQESAVKR